MGGLPGHEGKQARPLAPSSPSPCAPGGRVPSLRRVNPLSRPLLACLLASTACVHRDTPLQLRIHDDLPSSGPELSFALYQSVGVPLRPGHTVQLVQDERILATLEEEIHQAHESLHLLVSGWQPGEDSERLLRALAGRPPGVVCRVLVDPLDSPRFHTEVEPRLVQTGCEVRGFRPLVGSAVVFADERLDARNGRQLLIRDGRVGLTGGSGVGEARRDTYVRVEGPAARQLQQTFARSWQESGGGLLPASAFPALEDRGEALAGFVASTGSPTLSYSERMVQVLLASARHRLWLTNGCFVPTMATVDTLIRKAQEGVDVRVLVPGVHPQDTHGVLAAQRSTYERLLENGVRLWEYQPSTLGARTVVVDEHLVAVGSTNLEPNSNASLEEGSLVVEDASLARALAASFEEDLSRSVEIRRDAWRKRGYIERFYSRLPSSVTGCH